MLRIFVQVTDIARTRDEPQRLAAYVKLQFSAPSTQVNNLGACMCHYDAQSKSHTVSHVHNKIAVFNGG